MYKSELQEVGKKTLGAVSRALWNRPRDEVKSGFAEAPLSHECIL